jgi:hypothetical protein
MGRESVMPKFFGLPELSRRLTLGLYPLSRKGETMQEQQGTIEARGREDGRAAASWIFNPGSEDAARRLLVGIEDGDPMILDELPAPSFGEWADDRAFEDVLRDEGVEPSEDGDSHLFAAYVGAFGEAVQHEAERLARQFLGLDCEGCGRPLNPVQRMLGPVCRDCVRKRHAEAVR